MTNNLRIIYLELYKYIVSDENIKYKLSKWVDFLQDPINLNKETVEDEDIKQARETLNYISTDDKERTILDAIQKSRNDFYNDITTAKEEGKEEGLIEGEKNKSIEIAKNMLKKGYKIEDISEISGLTIDEIKNLEK